MRRGANRSGHHNLFDVAWALAQREARDATDRVEIEMLEGMANPQALAVRDVSGDLLLDAPVARRNDFESAIAYLVRRLDENPPRQFLRALFSLEPGSPAWDDQRDRSGRRSLIATRFASANRRQDRDDEQRRFGVSRSPTSPTRTFLCANRRWIARALAAGRPDRARVGAVVAGVEVSAPLRDGVTRRIHTSPRTATSWPTSTGRACRHGGRGGAGEWVARGADDRRDVLLRAPR